MTILVASLVILAVSIVLVVSTRKDPASARIMLRESLFRNKGVLYRNSLGLLLGATASILLLAAARADITWVAWTFVATLAATMALLIFVRPNEEHTEDRFAWGLLVIIVLGFGVGALTYQYRHWIKWLWNQYRRINEPHELLLESLFLLGIILGFFVVRNWAKEQKDFVSSLSAVLGGAFVATILGKLQGEGITEIGALKAFAYYALGFTISGTMNLAVAARLTASYINKNSISSRAMLDFLYGSERTKLIDGYFLKNFNEDPDYARRWLTETLVEHHKLIKLEFAEKMELRKREREDQRLEFVRDFKKGPDPDSHLEQEPYKGLIACEPPRAEKADAMLRALEERLLKLCHTLHNTEDDRKRLAKEIKSSTDEDAKRGLEDELAKLNETLTEKKWLERKLSPLKPSYYYQLIAVERDKKAVTEPLTEEEREYAIIYKHIPVFQTTEQDLRPQNSTIKEEMFRVGIAMRRQDKLEYIVAPGQYREPFPVLGSVAGLALLMNRTIVMDRDKDTMFRSKDYGRGISPGGIEQSRGLDGISYLSYFSIPIVARSGSPNENSLGISNVDTSLFVTRFPLRGDPVNGSTDVFRTILKNKDLSAFANNLYEAEDKAVQYVHDHTKIITPVLELYAKCRVGSP